MLNSFSHPRLGYCTLRRGPCPRYLVRSPNGHCYLPISNDLELAKYLSSLLDPCAIQVLYVDSCRSVFLSSSFASRVCSESNKQQIKG